jgi:regulator of sigma E protease
MSFIIYYVLPFIVVLGILIFFHELGHFLVAKYFGVKVLKFSLGFGLKLVGKKIGETEYLISSIPLGGYVKLLGENGDDDAESIPPEEAHKAFNNQRVTKRMAIVVAGPLFNIFLALVLFCGFSLVAGSYILTPEIGQVREDSPAHKAGLMKGDTIVSLQGQPVKSWQEIKGYIKKSAGKPLEMTIQRGKELFSVSVVPEQGVEKNLFGEEVKSALIGIVASGKYKKVELGVWEAIAEGFLKTWEVTKLTCLTIIKLFQGVVSIKTLGGPIMIGQLTGQAAQEGLSYLIPLLAVISINLGVLNLLPVPILDGGLIIFFLIELIIGKPISLKKRDVAQKVGIFFLAVLIVVVTMNDLSRIEAPRRLYELYEKITQLFG